MIDRDIDRMQDEDEQTGRELRGVGERLAKIGQTMIDRAHERRERFLELTRERDALLEEVDSLKASLDGARVELRALRERAEPE